MRIVVLSPPGRLPTVVHDPGDWWSRLAAGDDQLQYVSLNAAWWQLLCSPAIEQELQAGTIERVINRVRRVDLQQTGRDAAAALDALSQQATYACARRYVKTIGALTQHLETLNRAQSELHFSVTAPVRVVALNYDDSRSLAQYADTPSMLSKTIERALTACPAAIDLLVVRITCTEDLLTAMIAVQLLRRTNPTLHACLADHGYEDFSLSPHLERLRATGALAIVFDSIITAKDERDDVLQGLVQALRVGAAPSGFLEHSTLPHRTAAEVRAYTVPPAVPTFACEPIFWTRLSARRCYWSRCTFCVQNAKYDHAQPPSLAEIPAALERLTALAAAYRTFIFSDEALSPAWLEQFCKGIIERGLKIRWACRCKLEKAFTPELFRLMAAAGCYEVLFGLESISPRMLQRMDKYVEGLDAPRIAAIFKALSAAGIGVHINMIANFPGDTPAELRGTVDFVVDTTAEMQSVTYLLNRFALFPATPIMQRPAEFGIAPLPMDGDMPSRYRYRVAPTLVDTTRSIDRLLPSFQEQLFRGLGWEHVAGLPGAREALRLYILSGHGAVFKTQKHNAFDELRVQEVRA